MMSKFTALCFFFASSLLRENFASIIKDADLDRLAAGMQKLQRDITDLYSTYHSNVNKIYGVPQQADNESTEEGMVAKIASLNDITLTTELVGLADGFHLIIPNGERGVEIEQRIEAIAIVNMLMNLKTMERMDTILANCSLASTMHVLFITGNNESLTMDKEKITDKGREYIGRLFAEWLRLITIVLENDSHLSEEFTESKDEARKMMLATGYPSEVSPPTLQTISLQNEDVSVVERKLAEKMFGSHLFRRMSMNRQFLKAASKQMSSHKTADRRRQFLLARALLDLAGQRGEDERVNEIYRKTLSQVTESVSEVNMMEEMRDKFFEALEKEIEADRDLAKRLRSIESKLDIWIVFKALRRGIAFV